MRYFFLLLPILCTLCTQTSSAQAYDYYALGDTTDVSPTPLAGSCLMGGASEDDGAMTWFIERASGGNVLVIRASGSDGYQNYLYEDLGVDLQSVETIVFNTIEAAEDPFVLERIQAAEAIWIAGGDQWDYVSYWRDSSTGLLLRNHTIIKQAPIGGTSAGMAILGEAYFSAENGTVTTAEALADPYDIDVAIGVDDFMRVPYLEKVITDTHYDSPDRKGRHTTFLARLMTDQGEVYRGIACEEYTAVCIDENGLARVFGDHPEYDDFAYFIAPDCAAPLPPENCVAGQSLTWDRDGRALRVYKAPGTSTGSTTFDLNDWITADGGNWEHWSVIDGQLDEVAAEDPDCITDLSELSTTDERWWIGAEGALHYSGDDVVYIEVIDMQGRLVATPTRTMGSSIALDGLTARGMHLIRWRSADGHIYHQRIML